LVDPQPEPDQATWAKVSITVERSDGGIVDAEIIRRRSWILRNGICAGRMLPFKLPELEVSGLALVTAIDDCPPIADGEGSVVTARFVTREVHVVASVDVLGADGTVETITGTTIHPVWSVDRQEWVPLAELAQGEGLCCDPESLRLGFPSSLPPKASGLVLSVSLSRVTQPVYNIEVHGEHVYQVGELGVVVHNAYPVRVTGKALAEMRKAFKAAKPQAWMREATVNASKYTAAQLERMKKGLAPLGDDGLSMEIHHIIPLAEGGTNAFSNFQFLTRTLHRLGANYKLNHPNLP
jgi:hypothetical protein